MDFKIAGVSFYYIISWFFIYSFLGWIWESVYVSVKKKKPVNRGFISGPLCTIYGVGAVVIYLMLKPFEKNLLVLYLGGVAAATVLEYITGWLMEKIFRTRWWDYSKKKFNLHGYICLGSSIAWGFFTLLLFYVLHPFVSWITGLYPEKIGRLVLAGILVLYTADFISSAWAAFGLSRAFAKLEDMREDLITYLHNSRLYSTKEEIRERLDVSKGYLFTQDMRERLAVKKQEVLERFEELVKENSVCDTEAYSSRRRELEAQLDEFAKKCLAIRKGQNVIRKRMVRAYPELKSQFHTYRDKHQKKRPRNKADL